MPADFLFPRRHQTFFKKMLDKSVKLWYLILTENKEVFTMTAYTEHEVETMTDEEVSALQYDVEPIFDAAGELDRKSVV